MSTTKIICTIGPSSANESVLCNMVRAGMDVARLNFSHGSHATHQYVVDLIRQVQKKLKLDVKLLQDLEGYRVRIGTFNDGKEIELTKGQRLLLTNQAVVGEKNIVPFDYEGPLSAIGIGSHIFLDDGNIAMVVRARTESSLETEVIVPGVLKEHKGVNMPDVALGIKGLKQKDRIDVQFGLRNKVDYIAQSFVRGRDDIVQLRQLIHDDHPQCQVIAKIESRQGIENINEILEVSDGIMIARGDMGVSIPIYEIPIVQKEIIKKCNRAHKFVITATQMLESMVEHVRPTRAEVTDVANAVLDGSDFVMLSAETAAGRHPVEAVKMMEEIIVFTEKYEKHGPDVLKSL